MFLTSAEHVVGEVFTSRPLVVQVWFTTYSVYTDYWSIVLVLHDLVGKYLQFILMIFVSESIF